MADDSSAPSIDRVIGRCGSGGASALNVTGSTSSECSSTRSSSPRDRAASTIAIDARLQCSPSAEVQDRRRRQKYGRPMTESVGRRLFQLVEPVAVVTYMADEPTAAVMALGLDDVWDAYFAGRAAPLGRDVPAAVVHALFYNFADGEVARHIPGVWDTVTPEAANAAREQGSVAALRRILGELADTPGVVRAGDLAIKAGTSARTEGRGPLRRRAHAARAHRTDGAARHGANLLREHRGDGHVAAL